MNSFKNYLEDCLQELVERATQSNLAASKTKEDFEQGRSMAYYEVISYLIEQAEVFDIKKELSDKIRSFNPDRLLNQEE